MSYTINLTNGTTLIPGGLPDGTIDNTHSSLTLIGRDYAGYGQFLNENFVYLLENFAASSGPANPLAGQLWWDTANNILKVWSGSSWKISTGATSSPYSSPPGDLSALGGDLWFDTTNSQLKVYSGSSWITVGPVSTPATGNTGATPALMTDTSGGTHIVIQFTINGVVYAIFSKDTFSSALTGFATITAGLNFSTTASPALGLSTQSTAASASTLVLRDASAGITAAAISGTTGTFTGAVTASSFSGALVGNLVGNVSATTISTSSISAQGVTAISGFTGQLLTAAQPYVTSVGTLGGLSVSGITSLTGTATLNGAAIATVGGTAPFSAFNGIIGNVTPNTGAFTTITASGAVTPVANAVINLGSPTAYWGGFFAATVNAGTGGLVGTLQTSAQPNVTSVGTLSGLTVGGNLIVTGNATLNGTQIAVQGGTAPYNVFNGVIGTTLPNTAGFTTMTVSTVATPTSNSAASLGNTTAWWNNLYAVNHYGTIQTGYQPNITTVGTLNGLTVNGTMNLTGSATLNGSQIATYSASGSFAAINNTPIGNATPSTGVFTTLGASSNVFPTANATVNMGSATGWFNNFYAVNHYGTLQTAAQPNITSLGNVTNLTTNGTTNLYGSAYLNGVAVATVGVYAPFSVFNGIIGNVTPASGAFTTISTSAGITPTANATIDIGGSPSLYFGNIYANTFRGGLYYGTLMTGNQPNITGVGTITSGTWGGNIVSPTYGGTGVNNGLNTLTLSGASYTLNQSVASGASPTFVGSNFSGNATALSIGGSHPASTLTGTTLSGNVLYSSLTTAGNIISGTWSGSIVGPGYGGTGVNNGTYTITLGGSYLFNQNVAVSTAPIFAGTNFTGNATAMSIGGMAPASRLTGGTLSSNVTASSLTTVGTLSSLNVAGAITVNSNNGTTAIINGGTSGTGNIGQSSDTFNYVFANYFAGTATTAQYADLAERYESDAVYSAGTVVQIGGAKEITQVVEELSDEVFGVISTNAAYLMNNGAGSNDTHPAVALAGRVPVRVIGTVKKGDRLVSAGNGLARAGSKAELTPFNVIGRALVDKLTEEEGVIEAAVSLGN